MGTTAVDLLAKAMMKELDALATRNRPLEPARTPCDFLSRDRAEYDAYVDDPLCGFSLVSDSMLSLLSQGGPLADLASLKCIPAEMRLYILVWAKDVLLTDFGRLEPLIDHYGAAGLNTPEAIYPDGRHEILNEVNRNEVVIDLLDWLNGAFAAKPRPACA